MFKNLRKKKKGFTLIELIIVIAIIAILAAVAVPKFGDVRKNAALKADVANAKVIADATSALLAEDASKLPNSPYTIGDAATANDPIELYLQNVPKPQTVGFENYVVTIDTAQNVTVKMTGTGNKSKDLYPILGVEPATPPVTK